jgi:UDP-2,3-diacylglucosamine pyrophosphatase LpxH
MNDDQADRIFNLVGEVFSTVKKIDAKVEQTRGEMQDEFAAVKARLYRIEVKHGTHDAALADHEARISAIEKR